MGCLRKKKNIFSVIIHIYFMLAALILRRFENDAAENGAILKSKVLTVS